MAEDAAVDGGGEYEDDASLAEFLESEVLGDGGGLESGRKLEVAGGGDDRLASGDDNEDGDDDHEEEHREKVLLGVLEVVC